MRVDRQGNPYIRIPGLGAVKMNRDRNDYKGGKFKYRIGEESDGSGALSLQMDGQYQRNGRMVIVSLFGQMNVGHSVGTVYMFVDYGTEADPRVRRWPAILRPRTDDAVALVRCKDDTTDIGRIVIRPNGVVRVMPGQNNAPWQGDSGPSKAVIQTTFCYLI